jgi:hypothetical protein
VRVGAREVEEVRLWIVGQTLAISLIFEMLTSHRGKLSLESCLLSASWTLDRGLILIIFTLVTLPAVFLGR